MRKYILKRILMVFPTLLVIIFIVFSIMNLTPGDPARVMLGPKATPEAVEKLNQELGIDRPFLIRYTNYVVDLFQGDMGKSYRTGRPVFEEIVSRLPTTIKLATIAIFLAILIGVPLGILAAVKQYSVFDIMGTAVAMLMASFPGFWLGLLAILLFSLKLGLLPSSGNDTWMHYIMPAFTLAIPVAASLLRLTRTTMLETIRQDYIRTARAKGQTEGKVIFQHALKNALLPVITVSGVEFGGLLGGVVTIETVFSVNGVGTLIIEAIRMKDIPQVTGCALFLAFFFMMVMLLVDILYAYIDPRIRARYQRG
jgi:peptide/nickel transport system permease protein